ncbi:MAG: GIY-YIG nuclease family protein [Corallococcus sp.]|nr:GIY-YIG nuclease family protein [Corallococcus sp.]
MSSKDYFEIKQAEQEFKTKWLKVNPYLTDDSGIYMLTRQNEEGFKFAYIGQARHVLTRLAQHLKGCDQHIDLSLKKHGLWDGSTNPYGWFVQAVKIDEQQLDEYERKYIKHYADYGYQLRNKTSGSQGKGKKGIAENKPAKGYYDGKKQGRADVIKELQKYAKYVEITPVDDKKLSKRMCEKFCEIIGEKEDGKG